MESTISQDEIQKYLIRKQKAREYAKEYRKTHKEYHKIKQREYRARKKQNSDLVQNPGNPKSP